MNSKFALIAFTNLVLISQTLQFQVQAIAGEADTKRMSLATVNLEIIDANDNSPTFSEEVCLIIIQTFCSPSVMLTYLFDPRNIR